MAEFVLDTPVVREFVADVRDAIAASRSPTDACERIRPQFSRLLADPQWLPEQYQADAPGQRYGRRHRAVVAVPRRGWVAVAVLPGRAAGRQTPIHDHLAWGLVGLYRGNPGRGRLRADATARSSWPPAARLSPGDLYALRPPRDDIHRVRTTSIDTFASCWCSPPASERHRLRVAARVRRALGRRTAVSVRLCERRVRRPRSIAPAGLLSRPAGGDGRAASTRS